MWRNLVAKIRQVMYRMGLIKGLEKITDHKEIYSNDEMYDNIEVWKSLYRGYYEPFHRVRYKTISGWKERTMQSLQMPKIVSSEMAALVFNEKCEISIDNETVKEFIDAVFEQNHFNKEFQDHLEFMFAHGGAVIKPYVEDDKIKLSFVTADCFVPVSWHNGYITEAVFVSEYRKGDKQYTHLEWHTWDNTTYVIKNELYESEGNELGIKVPLSTLFPNLEPEVRINGLKRPLFVYFKPNTANNIDTQSPLGISIFANALDTIKALDTAFDSFHREFRLGRKRIVVPAHMVQTVIDPETGQGYRYFDDTDEVYEAFNDGNIDENKIHDISVELRVEEHISAINALLNIFAMQTGFSAGTFSFDGKSVKTATEVVSENSKTFKSKKSHEIIIEEGLRELITTIIDIALLYGLYNGLTDYEVSVAFDDSIVEDENSEIDKQIKLVNSGLTSRKRAIMRIHKCTEEEALQILQEIFEEERRRSPELEELQAEGVLFGERE